MKKPNQQPGPDPKTLGPILEALRQALPGLEKLVEACHHLFPATVDDVKPSLCDSCDKKGTCTKLCDQVLKVLAGLNSGRGRRENQTGFYPATLEPIQKIWQSDVFNQYESCKQIFTPLQWEAIYHYYGQGLTQEQVGTRLGKKRKAISGLLQRAKARKAEHDRKIRAEKYEAMKKNLKEEKD